MISIGLPALPYVPATHFLTDNDKLVNEGKEQYEDPGGVGAASENEICTEAGRT